MMWPVAFVLGFAGSLHCVGMCSPLAMLVAGNGSVALLTHRLLYHAGKGIMYVALGVVAGLFGNIMEIKGVQSYFSIGAGLAVVAFLVFPELQKYFSPKLSRYLSFLKGELRSRLNSRGKLSVIMFGAMNGLLPCGLVYMALAVATLQSSLLSSMSFMGMFAIGTMPALLAATYSAQFMRRVVPLSLHKWRAALLIVTAVIMIGRGLPAHWLPLHAGSDGITLCR